MTTLAAKRANDDDAPTTAGVVGAADGAVVGCAVGDGVDFDGDGEDLTSVTGFGAGVAVGGRLAASVGATVAAAFAAAPPSSDSGTAAAAADADADGDGDGTGDGRRLGCGRADGLGDTLGAVDGPEGVGLAATLDDGVGERSGAGTATAGIVAAIVGAGDGPTSVSPCRPTNETPAPMTNPSTMTPIKIGTSGSDGPDGGGGRRRVRRGGGVPCITPAVGTPHHEALTPHEPPAKGQRGFVGRSEKWRRVIRVAIPIDVGTIAATANSAFALATPIRVDRLIALAVIAAGGARAPQEKRERTVRATLDGFRAGRFVVDVDGRIFDRPETVVVCAGTATLRFFSTEPAQRERETAL